MAFENDTNAGRVQKMIDTLALIEKSAMANRASNGDLADMLQPLSEALAAAGIPAHRQTGAIPAMATPPSPSAQTSRAPQWATVREMAEQADLKDLTYAMAVYLNRIDEVLS